jgi:hypothetical protein
MIKQLYPTWEREKGDAVIDAKTLKGVVMTVVGPLLDDWTGNLMR